MTDKQREEFEKWWQEYAMLLVSRNPADYVIGYANARELWQAAQAAMLPEIDKAKDESERRFQRNVVLTARNCELIEDKDELNEQLSAANQEIERLRAVIKEHNEPVAHMVMQKNRLSIGAMYRSKEEALMDGIADWEISEVVPLYTHPVQDVNACVCFPDDKDAAKRQCDECPR